MLKKRLFRFAVCFIPILYTSFASYASADSATPLINRSQWSRFSAYSQAPQMGLRLFGGLGLGYGAVSGGEFSRGPGGGQYLLDTHLNYQMRSWSIEFGLGWLYSRVSGANREERPLWINTRSGFADFSVRYRVYERWQLGPVISVAFGTDTTQAPTVGDSQHSYHGGLRVAYELPLENLSMRFWQQISTSLSLSDRRFATAMIGIELGLPIKRTTPAVLHSDAIQVSTAAPAKKPNIKIILDSKSVFFHTDSSKIKIEVQKTLSEVGHYLRMNPGAVSEILVTGHADMRGQFKYNLDLSERRAISVKNALVDADLAFNEIPIRVEAHSYLIPADANYNAAAWAKNRRVELIFREVQNVDELMAALQPITQLKPLVD